MLEGIDFYYDGVYSVDMGLINVTLDGGMFEETFLPTRELREIRIAGRDKSYFQRIEYEPLSFKLTFAFEHGFDEARIREVARWLNASYFKPFYTTANMDRIYYCMPVGDSQLFHNGLKEGYITIEMRCDSPFSYTPQTTRENIYFGANHETFTIGESNYTNATGTMDRLEVKEDGSLTVDGLDVTWENHAEKLWGDI